METSITMDIPINEEQDLCLNTFGHSVTKPCHKYGPAVRSYYLIHFILDGKGEFFANQISYKLKKGQGFLIEPDEQTVYMADEKDPWTYIWVGFSGRKAGQIIHSMGLSRDNPVFSCDSGNLLYQYVIEMIAHNRSNPVDTYRTLGTLYLFFSVLADSRKDFLPPTDSNTYIQHAISYIQDHIQEPLKIQDIASYVNLNRSYLSVLFKKQTGMSPLSYIQTFRVTKAKHLLESTSLSVSSIAFSCGYQKPESLIKFFKKTYGLSPTAYRKKKLAASKNK